MQKSECLNTCEVGVSEFIDSRKCSHRIKHSVILSDSERHELEERIAEELYRIFTDCKS